MGGTFGNCVGSAGSRTWANWDGDVILDVVRIKAEAGTGDLPHGSQQHYQVSL